MRQWWWKILGAVIVLGGLVIGMLVPLKPGIVEVSPRSGQSGSLLDITVQGYNTRFDEAAELSAFLKLDSTHILTAQRTSKVDANTMRAEFLLPQYLPTDKDGQTTTLIVNSDNDGYIVLPEGIHIKQEKKMPQIGQGQWSRNKLHNIHKLDEFRFPYRPIINETIRNTFYHITLWFAMFILMIAALVYSIWYLRSADPLHDTIAASFTKVAILLGGMGLVTGMIWARFTWGAFWTDDVKLNMTAVAMLIYVAYLILRGSIPDRDKRGRLSAAYNIFAFVAMIPLIFVVPRLTDSLHPGNGGNPALGGEDMDNTLRMIFYPTIIGITLIGVWLTSLLVRFELLKDRILDE